MYLYMAAQYDVNLDKCALLKCLWRLKLNSARCKTGAGALTCFFGHTDKSSLIHLSNL